MPRFYYKLVDAKGQQYPGAEEWHRIALNTNESEDDIDVLLFQSAVKREYSDTLLNGIAPHLLKVYKNEKTFNSTVAVPLDREEKISQYGGSSKEPLFVVVPQVWFHLVDAAGEPYQGAAVACVNVGDTATVDEFRNAVTVHAHAIFAGNRLQNVNATDLQVYAGSAALRADDNSLLSPTSRLDAAFGAAGAFKESPLLVVVPPAFLALSQPCGDPFFNKLHEAWEDEDSGILTFRATHRDAFKNLNCLFVRKSYKEIADRIFLGISTETETAPKGELRKVLISGTPGTGKTCFLFYLLWKLVKKGERVLFVYKGDRILYNGRRRHQDQGNVNVNDVLELSSLPHEGDYTFWNEKLWCLLDAKGLNNDGLRGFPDEKCQFILGTSPKRLFLNDFRKPPKPQFVCMPLWNEQELRSISTWFGPDSNAVWLARFKILGGIPRYVLEDISTDSAKLLRQAAAKCVLFKCIKITDVESNCFADCNVPHALIHMKSESPYKNFEICYASDHASYSLFNQHQAEAMQSVREIFDIWKEFPLVGSFLGHVFEFYAISKLEKGGEFEYCRLNKPSPKKGQETQEPMPKRTKMDTMLHITASKRKEVEGVAADQRESNQLYVPYTKNHAGIDAWNPKIGMFQITIGEKHDIKEQVKGYQELLGENFNNFYWLLPPSRYATFKFQPAPGIKMRQYAVCIPLPNYKIVVGPSSVNTNDNESTHA